MKLEHLIQAYNHNKIPAKIKEQMIDENGERAGTIEFDEYTYASYLQDEEGFVTALNFFVAGLIRDSKTINVQVNHAINTLVIIQKSIELLGNRTKEEANSILRNLGAFSNELKEKAVEVFDYIYKIDAGNGLLMFSIIEKKTEHPQ